MQILCQEIEPKIKKIWLLNVRIFKEFLLLIKLKIKLSLSLCFKNEQLTLDSVPLTGIPLNIFLTCDIVNITSPMGSIGIAPNDVKE